MHITSGDLNLRKCCKGDFLKNKSDCKAKMVNQQQGRQTDSSRKRKLELPLRAIADVAPATIEVPNF